MLLIENICADLEGLLLLWQRASQWTFVSTLLLFPRCRGCLCVPVFGVVGDMETLMKSHGWDGWLSCQACAQAGKWWEVQPHSSLLTDSVKWGFKMVDPALADNRLQHTTISCSGANHMAKQSEPPTWGAFCTQSLGQDAFWANSSPC